MGLTRSSVQIIKFLLFLYIFAGAVNIPARPILTWRIAVVAREAQSLHHRHRAHIYYPAVAKTAATTSLHHHQHYHHPHPHPTTITTTLLVFTFQFFPFLRKISVLLFSVACFYWQKL